MSSRVLVLDDSAMLVELTTRALVSAGFEAAGAMDLADLDRQLNASSFDLILVDVKMPEIFGDDVVDFLRNQRRVRSKLILYSDLPERELSEKAAACGADGYICKANGIEFSMAAVRRYLGAAQGKPAPGRPTDSDRKLDETKRKRRILVVDRSEVTAQLLERELSPKGFEVTQADSVDEATKIILKKKTRPYLVLLDVRMPNAGVEQLCRFIKGNDLFSGIKVLLCSEEDEEELPRICRKTGADGYLPKNAALSQLLARELA